MGHENHGHAELALQLAQQQQDLDLHGGVQRRGRLVRQQDFRLAGQRQRDHRALPHAAAHFVRIGLEAAFGGGDAHHLQHFQRAGHRLLLALAFMAHHAFRDLVADRVDGIERQRGFLKNHRNGLATKRRQLLFVHRQHVAAQNLHSSRNLRPLPGQQPHQRAQGHALARAGFAEQAEHLALAKRERDVVDGMNRALAGEADVEVADFDEVAHAALGTLW